MKRRIWKLKILPKIQVFLWKVVSGAIPTAARMCARGIFIDPVCQRCCVEEETISHMLFECPHATAIWRCANNPLAGTFTSDLESNLFLLFDQMENLNGQQALSSFWIVSYIWKSRNAFLFSKRNVHPIEDARKALDANDEWVANCVKENLTVRNNVRDSRWSPPPSGWLKCNFDSSFRTDREFTGLGWIARDDKGRHLASGMAKIDGITSSLIAEASSFLFALQQMWVLGWRQIWFEGDCSRLTAIINKCQRSVELGNLLSDITYWMSKMPLCSLEQVNRERNQAADILSKKSLDFSSLSMIFNVPPSWLVEYMYSPFTI